MSTEDPLDTGHDYDGIREHDNKLPRWWLFTLYGAIGFAFAYWLAYHTFHVVPLPREIFASDLKHAQDDAAARDAAILAGMTDDKMLQLKSDPVVVENGRGVYMANCLPCHGDKGQGIVGPNLTDEYWIHGAHPTDALKVITDGVATKGMPTWKPVLGAQKVRDVAVFLLTLHNTHAPGGKAAEGVPEAETGKLGLNP